ncbi:superoxide dismutase [Chitinophaga pendula]|uniref:superoxide dismutase n=1 Tax=Chitinophaga TaxID=79328 RepID=UPI000BAF1E37|nr:MULTISPECIES: superoxide dismutase [Chitinophaga]ASZ13811.1 superoxide dismutase [Chitinophaga sp. MD30]UCJ08569.1 superoxide dismutase [Chitinophaga pendula]
MIHSEYPFEVPALTYAFDALEPAIDKTTMEIHHDKHHGAYVTNLNNAVKGSALEKVNLGALLTNVSKHSAAVRNNAGGHYNHSLFWTLLSPKPAALTDGPLKDAIQQRWGTVDTFIETFNKEALQRFGSGWVWLIVKFNGELEIVSTPNQDNPLMDVLQAGRGTPVIGLDVWEHAYYLHYQNKRADYVSAFWKVLDWKVVNDLYTKTKQ